MTARTGKKHRNDPTRKARQTPAAPPPPEVEARPVPRGYATRSRPLTAGPAARVSGGTPSGPTRTEKIRRFYEVTLPPAPAAARGDRSAKDREAYRIARLAAERAGGRAHPVRSDYFGTAEHRAAADYLKDLLEGRPPPFNVRPAVDPSHVLLRRKGAKVGPLGEEVIQTSALTVNGGGWRDELERELEAVFRTYDPLRELEVRPGRSLRYGEIVALAGDFYDTPSQLEAELTDEVAAAIRRVTPESDGTILLTVHRGVCKYVDLALKNVDHFAPLSWTRYAEHHREALEIALVERDLERALVRNAFADHFLTDAFASGHLRVARTDAGGRPAQIFRGLQAKAAHDAENVAGLWVENARGYVWRAYGDDRIALNAVHATLVAHALGSSIQRVYAAYAWEGDYAAALASWLGLPGRWDRPKPKPGTRVDPRTFLPEWLGPFAARKRADSAPALAGIVELIPVPVKEARDAVAGVVANYPAGGAEDADFAASFFDTFDLTGAPKLPSVASSKGGMG